MGLAVREGFGFSSMRQLKPFWHFEPFSDTRALFRACIGLAVREAEMAANGL